MRYIASYLSEFTDKTHTFVYESDSYVELFDKIKIECTSGNYKLLCLNCISLENASEEPAVFMVDDKAEEKTEKKSKGRKK